MEVGVEETWHESQNLGRKHLGEMVLMVFPHSFQTVKGSLCRCCDKAL